MSDSDLELVDGHRCFGGGKYPGYIRGYHSLLCSSCLYPENQKTNVFMLRSDMKIYNDRLVQVYESFQNALANGYDLTKMTPQEVTTDMLTYDASLEEIPEEILLPLVQTVMESKKWHAGD